MKLKFKNLFKKLRAFSLIELTISLVVISLILSALIPVMTSRYAKRAVTVEATKISSSCKEISSDCLICKNKECLLCDKTCPDGTFKDIKICDCVSCSVAHANCAQCDEGKCTQCKVGYYLSEDGKSCIECEAGYYCDGESKQVCRAGTYSNKGQGSCGTCDTGMVSLASSSSCTKCTNGKYANAQGVECIDCEVGNMCKDGIKTPCQGNKYQSATGKSSCSTCSSGSYVNDTNSACTPCEKGYKCNNGVKTACSKEGAASYSSSTGSSSCLTCSDGYYVDDGRTSCTLCPAGYECKNGQITACSERGTKYYQPYQGQTSCLECNLTTHYLNANRTSCMMCAQDTICNGNQAQSVCNAGYYRTASGCSKCSAGTYSSSKNASSCSPCSAGQYSEAGATSCKTCKSDEFSLAKSSKCTKCSQEYGEGCLMCDSTQCKKCDENYKLSDDNKKCVPLECPDKTIKITTANGDICVTKYNVGDGGISLSGVTMYTAKPDAPWFSASTIAACWSGETTRGCDSTNGGYSGCNRTLCNYKGAVNACNSLTLGGLSWRLPNSDEVSYFAQESKSKGNDGLMLCDFYKGYGSSWCQGAYYSTTDTTLKGNCTGSIGNSCYPSFVWFASTSSTKFVQYSLSAGAWYRYDDVYDKNYARSVRCVAELEQ